MQETKMTIADYPAIVRQWDRERNGDLQPEQVTAGSKRKIHLRCEVAPDHRWDMGAGTRVSNHRNYPNSTGCPYCSGQRVVLSNCMATTHAELGKELHRDSPFTAYEITAGSGKKAIWQCRLHAHHVWTATVASRKNGSGCPYCCGQKVAVENSLAVLRPDLAMQWDQDNNGDVTPYDVTAQCSLKAAWKCPVATDHKWRATVANRSKGRGCPCCACKKVVPSNCLLTTHAELSKEWHPTLNGVLTPADVCSGSHKHAYWKCKKGHDWRASIQNRSYFNYGCPVCNEPRGEKIIAAALTDLGIYFQRQFWIRSCRNSQRLRFDFVILPEGKMCCLIEHQGEQHFKEVPHFGGNATLIKTQVRDQIKRTFCRENDLPYLEIPYWEHDNIPTILRDFIETLPPRRRLKPA